MKKMMKIMKTAMVASAFLAVGSLLRADGPSVSAEQLNGKAEQLAAQPARKMEGRNSFAHLVAGPAVRLAAPAPIEGLESNGLGSGTTNLGVNIRNLVLTPYAFVKNSVNATRWGARKSEGVFKVGTGLVGLAVGLLFGFLMAIVTIGANVLMLPVSLVRSVVDGIRGK